MRDDRETMEVGKISFSLTQLRESGNFIPPFELGETSVTEKYIDGRYVNEAVAKIYIGEEVIHEAATGIGPLHALDEALRKCLSGHFPCVEDISVTQFCAHAFDQGGLSGQVRVILHFKVGLEAFSEVADSPSILAATQGILIGVYEYYCFQSKR